MGSARATACLWVNRGTNAAPTARQTNPYTLVSYNTNGLMSQRDRRHDSGLRQVYDLLWDGDDRLRLVQESGVTRFSALYNGDGLRVQKQDTRGALGLQTHNFSWGPGGLLHEDNPTTVYTPGFGHRSNGINKFYHVDWLGSTRYTSDATGNSFPAAMRFDAYGQRSATGGTDPYHSTDLQFAGSWGYQTEWGNGASDPGLGLQYLEQRYYDSATGRFISPDPIGIAGGLNLYLYPTDPVGGVDPTGLAPFYVDVHDFLQTGLSELHETVNDYWAGNAVGVGVATIANTGADLAAGLVDIVYGVVNFPRAVSQWGIGTAGFVDNPSLEMASGLGNDFLILAGLIPVTKGGLVKFIEASEWAHARGILKCRPGNINLPGGGEPAIPPQTRPVDVVPGTVRHGKSWFGEYAQTAYAELERLAKQGDTRAAKMKKAVEQWDRMQRKAKNSQRQNRRGGGRR
jgi:RHS repeat-associated protein